MDTYIIKFADAVTQIEAFVKKLKPHARGLPLGGTIDVASFWDQPAFLNFKGNMAWFCVPDTLQYPRMFLAFEENDSYDNEEEVLLPVKKELSYAQSVFGYLNENISDLLADHIIQPLVGGENVFMAKKISREKVVFFKENFKRLIDVDVSGRPLNKYPYGFFENVDHLEVNAFATQPRICYVRYYFGYDEISQYNEETNRIRIILVPVDENGKNIVSRTDDSPGNIMLQKSWPPPPNS